MCDRNIYDGQQSNRLAGDRGRGSGSGLGRVALISNRAGARVGAWALTRLGSPSCPSSNTDAATANASSRPTSARIGRPSVRPAGGRTWSSSSRAREWSAPRPAGHRPPASSPWAAAAAPAAPTAPAAPDPSSFEPLTPEPLNLLNLLNQPPCTP